MCNSGISRFLNNQREDKKIRRMKREEDCYSSGEEERGMTQKMKSKRQSYYTVVTH